MGLKAGADGTLQPEDGAELAAPAPATVTAPSIPPRGRCSRKSGARRFAWL